MKKTIKNPKIDPLIALTIIGILAIAVVVLSKESEIEEYQPQYQFPLESRLISQAQLEKTPWEGCKQIEYDPGIDYNFVSSIPFVVKEPPVQFLEIKKDQEKRLFSLGKFKLYLEPNTFLKIPKLWLYFFSQELSDRNDNMYGLEDSYLSKIILKVGKETREIKLGRSDEHSFIELEDCPLGNIYPVNNQTSLEFEVLLEIGCNNFKDGNCLDNNDKPLDYINGADFLAQIRLFAVSYQEFTKDIPILTHFKYE